MMAAKRIFSKAIGPAVLVIFSVASSAGADNALLFFDQFGNEHTQGYTAARTAAALGMALIPGLVGGDALHAEQLGFYSSHDSGSLPDVLAQLELGRYAWLVFRVNLNQLKTYTPQTNPEDLLKFSKQIMFPIVKPSAAGKELRSSLRVALTRPPKNWTAIRWGSKDLILELTKRQQELPEDNRPRAFVVWVPALNYYFVGSHRGANSENLVLTPLMDGPHGSFKAGVPDRASTIFLALRTEALTVNEHTPPR